MNVREYGGVARSLGDVVRGTVSLGIYMQKEALFCASLLLALGGLIAAVLTWRRMKHNSTARRAKLLILIGVPASILIVGLALFISSPLIASILYTERERVTRAPSCPMTLKMIGLTMHLYSEDYDGWFPVGPEGTDSSYALGILSYDLGEEFPYFTNVQRLLCPSDLDTVVGHWQIDGRGRSAAHGGLRPSSTSYEYVPGLRTDSLPSFIVAFDDAPRKHWAPYDYVGRSVLQADGSAAYLEEDEFQQRTSWQREMMKRIEEGGKSVPFDEWRESDEATK